MTYLKSNLHALAICYRIIGGFVALVISVFTAFTLSRVQLSNGISNLLGRAPLLMMLPVVVLVIIGATVTLVLFEVASSLQNRERRVFCLVVGWLMCAFFPLGTVLGVFTILQLTRPGAEETFAESALPQVKMEGFPEAGAEAAH